MPAAPGGASPFRATAGVINKVLAANQVRLAPTGTDEYQLRILRGAAGTTANIFEVREQTEASVLASVTGAGRVMCSKGSATLPGFGFIDDQASVGVSSNSSGASGNLLLCSTGGGCEMRLNGAVVNIQTGSIIAWGGTNSSGTATAADASLFRAAASTVGVGTGATTLGNLRIALGSLATPSLQFSGTSLGIYSNQSGDGGIGVSISGVDIVKFRGTASLQPAAHLWAWSSTGALGNTWDTAIGRSAAGVLGLYGGSAAVGSSLALASDKVIQFSSTTDPDGAADITLSRQAANVLQLGVGLADIDALRCSTDVEASTAGSGAPNLLDVSECRKLITNEGAAAEAYNTLPAITPGVGYEFEFYCDDADGIRVVAGAGDTIQLAGTLSGAAGFVRSVVVGSCIRLKAINATEWVAVSIVGTWTVDV